jgi:hypothetical protein
MFEAFKTFTIAPLNGSSYELASVSIEFVESRLDLL